VMGELDRKYLIPDLEELRRIVHEPNI
jgi:hypothetical protein